jgi:hypothetical protein
MRRLSVFATALIVSAAVAGPAAAQGGGLYEPFPEPAPTEQIRAYVGKLPGGRKLENSLTEKQLQNGTFLSSAGLRRTPTTAAASQRAGVGERGDFFDGWGVALVVGLVAAGCGALALRLSS